MIFRFNKAQLGRDLDEKLNGLLGEIQKGCDVEIEVWPLEFPQKFSIKAGDDVTVVAWDDVGEEYKILPSPEPEPEPEPIPSPEKLGVGAMMESPEPISPCLPDPMRLARLKYELMSTHLNMPVEKKIIFAKEYARLWSEHK